MKIYKYLEFLLEGNTPEDFINISLNNIKKRMEQAFGVGQEDNVKKMGEFQKYNLQLDGIEDPTNYNYSRRNLTIKFSDGEQNLYVLRVTMNLEDAIDKEKTGGDFQTSDIKKCSISFKKYNDSKGEDNFDIDEQLPSRSVDPESIDADFIIKLKVDLDEGKDPGQEEEFNIETDDNLPKEENPEQAAPTSAAQPSIQNNAQGGAPAQNNGGEQNNQQPTQGNT